MLNLDKVIKPDEKFILNKKEYTIPGSISFEQRVLIAKHAQKSMKMNDVASMEKMADAFLDAIEPANPGMDRKKFKSSITMQQLGMLFGALDGKISETPTEKAGDEKNGSGADLTD